MFQPMLKGFGKQEPEHWRAICPKCLAEAENGVCVEECGQEQIDTHAQWGNVYDLYHDLVEAV